MWLEARVLCVAAVSLLSTGSVAAKCEPPARLPRPLPDADAPPVGFVVAGRDVRLFLDDQPVPLGRERPTRFTTGEHTLRAEAPGNPSVNLTLRVDPFTPALVHVELDARLGLTVSGVGVVCSGCPAPVAPLDLSPLAGAGQVRSDDAFNRAAVALRANDWPTAAQALRLVGASARRQRAFAQLVGAVAFSASEPLEAERALTTLARGRGGDRTLRAQLKALRGWRVAEKQREREVTGERWNRTTERFGRFVGRFQQRLPGATGLLAQRFEELSAAFRSSAKANDPYGQEEALRAAEQALDEAVRQVQQTRADDCEYHREVLAAVLP